MNGNGHRLDLVHTFTQVWVVRCECTWSSADHDTAGAALTEGSRHLAAIFPHHPQTPKKVTR